MFNRFTARNLESIISPSTVTPTPSLLYNNKHTLWKFCKPIWWILYLERVFCSLFRPIATCHGCPWAKNTHNIFICIYQCTDMFYNFYIYKMTKFGKKISKKLYCKCCAKYRLWKLKLKRKSRVYFNNFWLAADSEIVNVYYTVSSCRWACSCCIYLIFFFKINI